MKLLTPWHTYKTFHGRKFKYNKLLLDRANQNKLLGREYLHLQGGFHHLGSEVAGAAFVSVINELRLACS
jgi:hypothetical protein